MKSRSLPWVTGTVLTAATICLSGCAGLGIVTFGNQEATIANPRINIEKGGLSGEDRPAPWTKAEDLLKAWGAPDERKEADSKAQLWTYRLGVRWNGIVAIAVIIPVPLIVPVGSDYVEFRIENDWVVSARTVEDTGLSIYGCVLLIGPHSVAGCQFGPDRGNLLGPDTGKRSSKFTEKPTDTYRIKIVNATPRPVTIVYSGDDAAVPSTDTRFTIEPYQSRHILSKGLREDITATAGEGHQLVRRPRRDFWNGQIIDSSLLYVVADNGIILAPVNYWDGWEAHLQEIINPEPMK